MHDRVPTGRGKDASCRTTADYSRDEGWLARSDEYYRHLTNRYCPPELREIDFMSPSARRSPKAIVWIGIVFSSSRRSSRLRARNSRITCGLNSPSERK